MDAESNGAGLTAGVLGITVSTPSSSDSENNVGDDGSESWCSESDDEENVAPPEASAAHRVRPAKEGAAASKFAKKVKRVKQVLGAAYAKLNRAYAGEPPPKPTGERSGGSEPERSESDGESDNNSPSSSESDDANNKVMGVAAVAVAGTVAPGVESRRGRESGVAVALASTSAQARPVSDCDRLPLRGIRKKEKPAAAAAAPSRATERKVLNVNGGYTESLALNVRLRRRPFTLTNRVAAEASGNNPPKCSQRKQFVTFRKRHTVRDIKFDLEGKIMLSTRHSVQRYDANGHYVEQLFCREITEPYGLWVSANGHVLVSDRKENTVKEFGSTLSLARTYGPVSSPRGVAQSSTGYVLVCAGEGQGIASRCVAVFHRHGQLHAVLGESKLRLPTHIALTDSAVVVSDHSRIVAFDTTGRRAFVYGSGVWNDYPPGLCTDGDGFIIATDYYQNAVCALRKDRDRATIVIDEMHGLRHPTTLARCPFGHLLAVVEKHSRSYVLKIFKLTD